MSNVETLLPPETVSETVLLIEFQTPAAPSTDHTMNTETTVTMPKAIDSRNDIFITDHGSIRLSRSRARRGARDGPDGVRRAVSAGRAGGTATGAVRSGAAGSVTAWTERVCGSGCWVGRCSVRCSDQLGRQSAAAPEPTRGVPDWRRVRSSLAALMRRWSRSAKGIRAVS